MKRQKIIRECRLAMTNQALGAGRTTLLDKVKAKYNLSDGQLKAACMFSGADYWNANRDGANG